MVGDGQESIVLNVTTFRRPEGLARLLGHLTELRVPDGHDFRVLVIDNDADGSAETVVAQFRDRLPLGYVIEAKRGISHARNRAVQESARATWVAFVDDDDWPEPDWLERLFATQAVYGADVVLGPTVAIFEVEPPEWIARGQFFGTDNHPTGTYVPHGEARTGGVLMRSTICRLLGDDPFDPDLGLTGGEDTDFFWRLEQRGVTFVWDHDAIVHEVVPPTKATARWLIRRSYRVGTIRTYILLHRERPTSLRYVKRLLRAGEGVLLGLLGLVTSFDKSRRVAALQRVAIGCGLAAGLFGSRLEEYRSVAGR